MDHESTMGLSPERLARLMAVGAEEIPHEVKEAPTEMTAEVLRERLAGPLPLDKAFADSVPEILRRPCGELSPVAGSPLGRVLLAPETDPAVLETVKEYGKGLSLKWKGGALHAAAVAVYYAAIASALVLHDRKITSHSYRSLADSFDMMIKKPWMMPELARLFKEAGDACADRKE
jgi:hypothetical protein